MILQSRNTAFEIDPAWDSLVESVYQQRSFLTHIEIHNPCRQRYYIGVEDSKIVVGAVVYSLKINLLTYAKTKLILPITIIGLPVSVDAQGLVGEAKHYNELISLVLESEKGIVVCLNYRNLLHMPGIVEMQTLPTLSIDNCAFSWENYLQSVRHNYRRRIYQAEKKFSGVISVEETCDHFTDEHYQLYLNIMQRTKTKLETLTKAFFANLPAGFVLHSYYADGKLLTWHITTSYSGVYYFLFGGINYSLRDKYDAYFNNLIQIIKEALACQSTSINLGQTAEISKNRLGARLVEKRMFIFHHNIFMRMIFRAAKSLLTYKTNSKEVYIYKKFDSTIN